MKCRRPRRRRRYYRQRIGDDALLTRQELRDRWPGMHCRAFEALEDQGKLKRVWLNGCTIGYRMSDVLAHERELRELAAGVMPERVAAEIQAVHRYAATEWLMIWQALLRKLRELSRAEQETIVRNIYHGLGQNIRDA